MKIFKYILLLILLSFVTLSVFIATQKGEYDVVRTKIIKSPKSVVYNYVNDYKNWENWQSWKIDDKNVVLKFPKKTIGKGGSYQWKGESGEGKIKTVFVKENDSIAQKMTYNNAVSEVYWSFKDTLGKTKVTWRTKGKLPFMYKIESTLKGGPERVIGNLYEQNLENLDKILDFEINTYSIKVKGIVTKLETFYIEKTINSKIENANKNIKIMLSKLIAFAKKNKIETAGKPFIKYHSFNTSKGITNFSVCLPIKEEIFTSPGSDISGGKLNRFLAVKTTLKGDYSHSEQAWKKTYEYISKNKLNKNQTQPSIEIYTRGVNEEKKPSKWQTDIYVAVYPKNEVKKTYYNLPVIATKTNIEEKTNSN